MGLFRPSSLACVFALLVACGSDSEVVPDDRTKDLEPACAREDCLCTSERDCLAHSECILSDGETSSRCECVRGYIEYGEFCVFEGVADPDIDGDPDAWQLSEGITIDSSVSEEGMSNDGAASWTEDAVNSMLGMTQTVVMPTLEDSEPFVAVLSQKATGPGADNVYRLFATSATLQLGKHRERLLVADTNQWEAHHVCLGESAYGVDLEVGLYPSNPLSSVFTGYAIDVDSVQIQPAAQDECPGVGEIVNGDFESPMGWSMQSEPLGTAEIRPDVGLGGTNAGYLEMNDCYCYQAAAEMSSLVNIPSAEHGGKAIRFAWRATPGTAADISIGRAEYGGLMRLIYGTSGRPIAAVDGTQETLQYDMACVPPEVYGTVTPLTISMRCDFRSELCAGTRSFWVDEIELVDAVGCPTSGAGADLSFELVENAVLPGWAGTVDGGRSAAVTRVDQEAFDGAHVLRLESTVDNLDCEPVEAHTSLVYPPVAAGERPAIRFQ